jgi:hypothetical protein
LKDFAVQNDLEKHVKFGHKVQQAKWIEEDSVWEVTVQSPTGEIIISRAEVLVSCHGGLKYEPVFDARGCLISADILIASGSIQISPDLTSFRVN